MTRRAPTYLRQPGDGEGLMPRQAAIILHMGVVKAPLCNSELSVSVSHLTEVFRDRSRVAVTLLSNIVEGEGTEQDAPGPFRAAR